jgi:site-specific recombinase XerD
MPSAVSSSFQLLNRRKFTLNALNCPIWVLSNRTILTLSCRHPTGGRPKQTAFSIAKLFESNRQTIYSVRTVRAVVKRFAQQAGIAKRVYPHLLRHSIATILLDSGLLPIDQVQKFLGHLQLSTTQIYAETSTRALGENYVRALAAVNRS